MNGNLHFSNSYNLNPPLLSSFVEASYNSPDNNFLKDIVKTEKTAELNTVKQTTECYKEDLSSSNEFTNTPFLFLDTFLNGEFINWLLQAINETNTGSKSYIITENEIKCFISIIYLSGYLNVPRRRLLWERSPDCHNSLVSNAIQRDRFDYIFSKLCCIPIKEENRAISKVCDFNKTINKVLLSHCPKGNHFNISQIRISSNRGLNAWCGTDRYGYCNYLSAFDENNFCNIVMDYAQKLAQSGTPNLELVFNNSSPAPELLRDLKHMNINVITDPQDSKDFHLMGIEKLQCSLDLYKSRIGRKTDFLQYITFCLDVILHNAYLLYKNKQKQDNRVLDMLGFRRNIVVYYLESHGKPIINRKTSKTGICRKRKICCESRFDGIRHYIVPQEKQTRCGECSQKTKTRCQKCDIGVHVKCFVNFHTRPKT